MPSLKVIGQESARASEARAGQEPLPAGAAEGEMARRTFLQFLGASAAISGLDGCFRPPAGEILPYVRAPEGVVPGVPLHYATATALGGFATGLLVTAYEGRPTKVEGNPSHPESLGATRLFEQAALFSLYDSSRAQAVQERHTARSWWSYQEAVAQQLERLASDRGAGLWFLMEPSASPTLGWLRAKIQRALPEARFTSWYAFAPDAAYEGARQAFGRRLEARADLSGAAVVVALDSDILFDTVRQARQYADKRVPGSAMNRLYVAESRLSVTGLCADHRLRVPSSQIAALALSLLAEVIARLPADKVPAELRSLTGPAASPWARAAADDLMAHPGAGIVLVGDRQPTEVHCAVHAINLLLGNVGKTVLLHEPLRHDLAAGPAALRELTAEIAADRVRALVVTAHDPVFTAPRDIPLAEALPRVPWSTYLGTHLDDTAKAVQWFLPAAHPLECWRDERASDGTATIAQPLLAPLFGGVSELELLAAFLPERGLTAHEILRRVWLETHGELGFELFWAEAVQRGVIPDTAAAVVQPNPDWANLAGVLHAAQQRPAARSEAIALELYPSYTLHDGRFDHNAWLQELPDPVTKLTWGNAALVSPATAEKLGLATFDVVTLTREDRSVTATTYVLPGTADGVVVLSVGHGRDTDRAGAPSGTNAFALQTSAAPWFASGLSVRRTGKTELLAVTQEQWFTEGRDVAPVLSMQGLAALKGKPLEDRKPQPSLYAPHPYPGYRWGMSIDLSRCTGCTACVMACASENNTPVVGRSEVLRGRDMHWLRIDRYFTGSREDPGVVTQPLMCVHCEDAPCEYVCPVNATVHSDEGLNEMIYNRCVGTRYCSNNCPYKVRRFNFLDWDYEKTPVLEMAQNPEVTVRSRGVMEKCTYCVQRIERARIDSQLQGRGIRDGEIKTACMQACPTQAIVFGTLSDATSEVSRLHDDERAYHLLNELGTRPRTVHLARVKNPNPSLSEV